MFQIHFWDQSHVAIVWKTRETGDINYPVSFFSEMRQKFDNGEDPLDPESQQGGGGGHPFHGHPFGGGGPFQFKFHFNWSPFSSILDREPVPAHHYKQTFFTSTTRATTIKLFFGGTLPSMIFWHSCQSTVESVVLKHVKKLFSLANRMFFSRVDAQKNIWTAQE